MARYGIRSEKVFGVSMATMRPLVRRLGRDHGLAQALWESGWLEARILAGFIDEPALVNLAQMERWVRQFDNWAVCDGTCLHLFVRTPHAWGRVRPWVRRRDEFVRRAGLALLAALAVHDKQAPDERFLAVLPEVERAAADERNFVRKAASWALRQVGKRNRALHAAALASAGRLAGSTSRAARWVGTDAGRELASAAVRARVRAKTTAAG